MIDGKTSLQQINDQIPINYYDLNLNYLYTSLWGQIIVKIKIVGGLIVFSGVLSNALFRNV